MPQNVYEDLLQKESLKNPYEELLQRREQQSPGPSLPSTPTTPTAAANPYEELLRRRDEADSVALKSSLQSAVTANPDAKAKAARIADRLHVPVDVVERNPEMFQEQDAVESLPYDNLLRQTPKLADWLSTPQNAAVSNDDLSNLTVFDQTVRIGTNLLRAPVAGVFRGVTAGLWGTIEAGADLAGFTNVAAYAARVQEAALQNTAAIRGAQTGAGWFEQQVYGGIESVGMQAPGILASIVSGTAYPRLAQLGLEAVPALATIGLQTGGEAYAQARAYPGRPAPVASPAAARAFAAGQGTVEVLTEMIPAERFLKDLGMNAGVLKTIAHQLVPEVAGEEIATLLQDLNEWAFLRPNAPFSQYLAERPSAAAATLISTIVAVGVQSAGGHATKRLIERLGATAAASNTVKRSPEAAEDLLGKETINGPLETHYADFDTWVTYWQSKGIDPAAAAATVSDNPQAFDPTTKAPIPISTAKWTVRMGPTEHNAFWANELREEPNKPNGREQTEADAFVVQQAAQAQPIATAAGTSTEQLQQRIQTQLEATGWESSIAADQSKLAASVFEATAAELRKIGVEADPLALYEAENIQFAREGMTPPAAEAGVPRETAAAPAVAPAVGQSEEDRLAAKKAIYAEALNVSANPAASADTVLSAQEQANKLGAPVKVWNVDGVITVLPAGAKGGGGPLIATLHPEAAPGATTAVTEPLAPAPTTEVTAVQPTAAPATPPVATAAEAAAPTAAAPGAAPVTPTTLLQTRRASITFGTEGVRIEFLKDADLTSFEHELSHLVLRIMERLATQYPGSRFATDLTLLTDWFGTTEIGPAQHEQLAEGFETYMEEGIAPSAELRPVFARIRAWFLHIYKALRRSNVQLTPEVRGVFDRWVATADAIAAAQAEGRVLPMFKDAAEMGVPEDQFAAYIADAQRLSDDAQTTLQKEVARETEREKGKRYQAQRKQVQAQVRAELLKNRAFRVRAALQRGTNPDGSPLVEGQKPEPLKGQPREVVAELFGFTSADEMNQALRAIKGVTLNAAIRQETARRMEALQGPQLVADPVQLADAAQDAVFSEGRAQLIAQELAALTKLAQQQREQREQTREARPGVAQFKAAIPKPAALKVAAEARVRQVRVRDLRPGLYLSAMQRASRMATEAALKRNIPAAIQAKQEELFSLAMYRATRDAKAAADAVVPWVQQHDTKTSRKRIGKAGESNIDQWDGLLHQYEFKNTTQKVLDRRASLRNWMESQQALGLGIDLPTSVLNQTQRVNYRELTVEELSGVQDAMRQLINFSYKKFDLLEAKEKRELDKKSTAVAERVLTTSKSRTPAARLTRSRGMLDSLAKFGKDLASSLLNPDTILRELDGWEDLGPVYTHLKGGIDRAIVEQLLPRLRAAGEAIEKLNTVYKPGELQKNVFIQSLRDSMTKEEVLTVMLNWGSPENRTALLESKLFADLGANEATVQDILSHADERDWNYVQSVWDYYQTFWPEVAESQRRRKGIIPKKVEAAPIVTPFGTKRGGYHPLKYEREGSIPATEEDIQDTLQQMQLGRFASMMTRDGFAKERVGSGGRTVLLSLGVTGQHVNEVIYDLSLGDAIQNSDRIMRTSTVREAFEKTGNTDAYMSLRLWLRDVATGEIVAADRLSKSLRFIRAGGTGAALLMNVSSVLVQPLGIAQTFAALNKRDAAGGVMDLFTRKWTGPMSLFAQVTDASPFMATRQTTFNKDITNAMARIQDSRFVPAWVGKAGFYLMTKSQWILDVATWLGAHRQGLRQFDGDTKKAVAFADRMVGRIGASGLLSDRSGFERGTIGGHSRQSEFIKTWTMLGSYMFAKGNLWYEKTKRTNFKSPTAVAGYLIDLTLLFTVEQLAMGLMRGLTPGDDDDDESWTWWLLKATAQSMAGTIPGIREVASEMEGFRGGGPLGDFARKVGQEYAQIEQGELDKALIKATNNLTGVFVHGYPSVAINRLIEAHSRAEEGEDVALIDYFVTRKKAQ